MPTQVLDVPDARSRGRRHSRLLRVLDILGGFQTLDGGVDLGKWFCHVDCGGCGVLLQRSEVGEG